MNRDEAIRLDGMIININASLDAVASYIKNRCPHERATMLNRLIGECMASLLEVHVNIVDTYPDIELRKLSSSGK